jgi:hypothetical protein
MNLPPIVDMIGTIAIEHGERGVELDAEHPGACLCGIDPYWHCYGPGIEGLNISGGDDGQIRVTA